MELTCVDPATGKGEGMGELKGGMVFEVARRVCARLLGKGGTGGKGEGDREGDLVVLEELGEKMAFEVAVGRNGRVWVKGETLRGTMVVGKALREVQEGGLGVEEQRRLVRRLVRELG